jgi:hypothetical protein
MATSSMDDVYRGFSVHGLNATSRSIKASLPHEGLGEAEAPKAGQESKYEVCAEITENSALITCWVASI